jgi:hypothetical protein
MKIRITAGVRVQNNSKGWDSRDCLSTRLLATMEYILNPTIAVIRIKIVMAWSWNKISCSIRGLDEFWNLRALHEGIIKEIDLYVGFKPRAFFCHINR